MKLAQDPEYQKVLDLNPNYSYTHPMSQFNDPPQDFSFKLSGDGQIPFAQGQLVESPVECEGSRFTFDGDAYVVATVIMHDSPEGQCSWEAFFKIMPKQIS